MLRTRWLRAVLVSVPGLLLAGFGVVHPGGINADTAGWWASLHIILLPVFPLLAAAQWHLLTPAPAGIRWLGRLAAFAFATYYTGLDAVAGIGAGTVVDAQHGYSAAVGQLFAVGDALGYIGAWSFLAANLLVVAAVARYARWRVVPGAALLLLASVSFLDSHIFWPRGVYTMIGIAVGMFLLSYVSPPVAARTAGGEHQVEVRTVSG